MSATKSLVDSSSASLVSGVSLLPDVTEPEAVGAEGAARSREMSTSALTSCCRRPVDVDALGIHADPG